MSLQVADPHDPRLPKPGILFRDITTLLLDARGFRRRSSARAPVPGRGAIDKVAGIEARGFILGGAVAHALGVGFVPRAQAGKLPVEHDRRRLRARVRHRPRRDARRRGRRRGERVLLVDDLVATGGTAEAAMRVIAKPAARSSAAPCIIDLPDLGGSRRIAALGTTSCRSSSSRAH